MEIVQFVRMFAIVIALGVIIISCGSSDPISVTGPNPAVTPQNTPTPVPPEIRRSDDGKTYVRTGGWTVPSTDTAEREEFETPITSPDGRSIKVYRTIILAYPLSLTVDNPLHMIDRGGKKIRIHKVMEFRTSAGVFCYKFLVNDADVEEGTNKVLSTRGVLYPFSYYDENGDGVFESLVLGEEDRHGRKGFASEPHLPKWAITGGS